MRPARILLSIMPAMFLLLVAGCSPSPIRFQPEGGSYDTETVTSAAKTNSGVEGRPVSDAIDLRHDALVTLRSDSDEGALLADLLTEQFPEGDRSVPYYAESGTFDGTPAWIVFEVWGSEGGTLDQRRVWVFDRETERVLFIAAVE